MILMRIYKDGFPIYSVKGKIAEERTKAKLGKLLHTVGMADVAFTLLKTRGKVYVGGYEFVWED